MNVLHLQISCKFELLTDEELIITKVFSELVQTLYILEHRIVSLKRMEMENNHYNRSSVDRGLIFGSRRLSYRHFAVIG